MVHVEVEEEELLARSLVAEMSPRADAWAYGIPSQARLVRMFREPEVAVVNQAEQVGAVEDGRMLAGFKAVVAPDADIVVAGQGCLQLVELPFQSLLRAEDLEAVGQDEPCHHRIALPPSVALQRVLMVGIADVVRCHHHVGSLLLGLCGRRGQCHHQQDDKSCVGIICSHAAKL